MVGPRMITIAPIREDREAPGERLPSCPAYLIFEHKRGTPVYFATTNAGAQYIAAALKNGADMARFSAFVYKVKKQEKQHATPHDA